MAHVVILKYVLAKLSVLSLPVAVMLIAFHWAHGLQIKGEAYYCYTNAPPRGKTNNVVSEKVRHKHGCTSTEKSLKLEISDLRRRRIVLSE